MKKANKSIRNLTLVIVVIFTAFLCLVELLKVQIVDGAYYAQQTAETYTVNQLTQAARGQIMTNDGVVLNSNKVVYRVIIQKAFFTEGKENETIARTINILLKNKEEWVDELPISKTQPYTFNKDSDAEIDYLRDKLELGVYATAENCINALYENYEIPTTFDEQTRRYIAGVRYQMLIMDFSFANRYVMAEDVSFNTVVDLKEMSFALMGIDIVEEPTRTYLGSEFAPHVLGSVGAISADEYEQYSDIGYNLNDTIGKVGIESAMEEFLRGQNGTRTIVRDTSGNVVSDTITKVATAGNTVKLTINSDFQNDCQKILENQIKWLRYNNDPNRGNLVDSGGLVVLNAKTGAVLAMCNYPNYDIMDYVDNYDKLLGEKNNPIYNRCIYGAYRPGSTFKTITATAGLISHVVDEHSCVYCGGYNSTYDYYDDYRPGCAMIFGGNMTVRTALQYSCNMYFYDVGRQVGIDFLAEVAGWFGVGQKLGLEIGGSEGDMSSPELYEEYGSSWNPGDTLQAAIGQCETNVSPLNLAVIASTLANDGKRYTPYLVDSIMNYDGTETIKKTDPTVAYQIEADEHIWDLVREGMVMVANDVQWPMVGGTYHFTDLPRDVAIKTGTPQVTEDTFNSTILGYYPADDPEIAFGIVLEKGEFTRLMVRNIIESYFYNNYKPITDDKSNITLPWGGPSTNTANRGEKISVLDPDYKSH